ncbi:MAG: hypothetical protein MRZ79_17560 [Bacteroidia bacterium]|nr:hypothetical protein [Bacteroidia bacterium]
MEFQELIDIWNEPNKELETEVQINHRLVKEIGVSRIKSRLGEIRGTAIFELIVSVFWNIFLIGFLIDHIQEAKYWLPALILLFISGFGMAVEGLKLFLYYSLKAEDSVQLTQLKLERLRFLELMDIRSLVIFIPLFVQPFLIVAAKALLHMDFYLLPINHLHFAIGNLIVAVILVFFLSMATRKHFRESLEFLKELKE